ncbi:hypothetical protein TPA0910_81030 [Streptomyces hygroscopicus subsp. sporocinereus]|uniref:NADPH-dependent reductive aminase-like C-terminal domain-containing protein n=1 Tax=Streptomyces hygroscopicus TaxID=1912 RepID=A0ABQ3UDJ3_STRHY|nr:hypothetical protein TPA0910_81030 [Streptomyces hygroscopicus]
MRTTRSPRRCRPWLINVHTSEAHDIDAGVMRAAVAMARRAIGLGHGTDGFIRVAEVLGRR